MDNKKAQKLNSWTEIGLPVPSQSVSYHICPICTPNRKPEHQKLKDFCINLDKFDNEIGRCNHCQIMYYVERQKSIMPKQKEYKPIEVAFNDKIDEKVIIWFKDVRHINEKTLRELKITSGIEVMPQEKGAISVIKFNFFENDNIVNIKYRSGKKQFKLYPDAKLIFYNINSIKNSKECIITEGEIDTASFHEAGLPFCISVPNGTQLSESEKKKFEETGEFDDSKVINMKYLENSWEHLKHIETFYIAVDNDIPGLKLRKELVRRLGPIKCKIIEFGDYKDANEVLCSENGVEKLNKCYQNAKHPQIEHTYTIDNDKKDILYEFIHGFKKGLPLGLECLDKYYSLMIPELDVINGIPGHGKTSFEIFIALSATIKYQWKWGIYCPEHLRKRFWRKIIQMYIGKTADKSKTNCMNELEINYAIDYLKKYFFLIDTPSFATFEDIMEKFRQLVLSFGINGFIMGPWNSIWHKSKGKTETIEEYLQRQLSHIRIFAKNHAIKPIIEAHPVVLRDTEEISYQFYNKSIFSSETRKIKRTRVPTPYDLAGGAMWFNRVDNILTPYYNNIFPGYGVTEIHVQKIKDQEIVGVQTESNRPIMLGFDLKTGRYSDIKYDHNTGIYNKPGICPLPQININNQSEILDYQDDYEIPF